MEYNFLIIGDLTGRRITEFINCLKTLNIKKYKVISWIDLFENTNVFYDNLKPNTIIKLEPPEKDMEIYRGFLNLGSNLYEVAKKDIATIDFSTCEIIAPRQWYEGFKVLFSEMNEIYKENKYKGLFLMNDFQDILIMMDKRASYEHLYEKADSSSFYLPKIIKTPKSYKDFKETYGEKTAKIFIKLRYGSGGTGVIAYKNNPRLLEETIFTSLNFEEIGAKKLFYSNNKINKFTNKGKIEPIINWVLENGAHIEEWVPKANYLDYGFDTRSLVINNKSQYLISRLSKTPITNLHLKNKRIESSEILSNENLNIIKESSEAVMESFKSSMYAGIDVVCSKKYKPYIIDVNPFGDLFHNLIGTKENMYYIEIKEAIKRLEVLVNGSKYE